MSRKTVGTYNMLIPWVISEKKKRQETKFMQHKFNN